ncbi:MAG: hypothetical protein LR120_00310 [Dehalococcoidia bacterium]|nr:hypothetical protein [Dehalococcoidia bacterium]
MQAVKVRALDAPIVCVDFDDNWSPFLKGQGPAGACCVSLSEADRDRLRKRLKGPLPFESDGSFHLIARDWGVRGVVSA